MFKGSDDGVIHALADADAARNRLNNHIRP
jgi:hypothetical protein